MVVIYSKIKPNLENDAKNLVCLFRSLVLIFIKFN